MPADLTDREHWETAIVRSAGRFFMLAVLAEQPRHGYDIAKRITELCGGCCAPSDAMIYPGIRDLTEAGLVACETESTGGRERKVCSLTPKGEEALRVASLAWSAHLPALQRVVELASGGDVAGFQAAAFQDGALCCAPEPPVTSAVTPAAIPAVITAAEIDAPAQSSR